MTDQVSPLHVRLLRRLPLVVGLSLVWLLLWGTFNLKTLFFGIVVAVVISVLFPVPTISTDLVVRPLRTLQLFGFIISDLLKSTASVSWQTFRHGPRAVAGIVEVPMRVDSDHLFAMVANAISLAPGNFVMQIDRANRLLYVYALGMTDQEAVREYVLTVERLVVRAVGSPRQVELITASEKEG